ncbi:MAG: PSD1 domain-containing protein [Planctomycetaceae bacterium]|nr:PSD1 domain-containing protein [Planctomycetales bacterium]MCB9873550.1 PSD1 domain-containing protein [Planctomycetaceae bacterium]MCB9937104.1 PSD1 domain-containing protein [Planctomycetaceae bacterium]
MQVSSVDRWAVTFCVMVFTVSLVPTSNGDERGDFFETRIRPVLVEKCEECHTGKTPEGDFRVDSLADLIAGGMNGPSVIARKPDQGTLVERFLTDDEDLLMPPDGRLPDEVIADFKKWIADGAYWPEGNIDWSQPVESDESPEVHWSFQALREPTPDSIKNSPWCKTPIDRFLVAKAEPKGIKPVQSSDKRMLIRRATLDLIGLPPTPDEVNAFLADDSPDAFEHVIDRLLESREYGVRWGRHWLDVARYADTSGDGTDTPIPEARYYRDYVISAFNNDMPYDQFVREQIAGDILAEQDPDGARFNEKIIATGYVALSRRFGNSKFASMELIIDDTVDTIGRSLLGLSLGCTRCHHHKFDPITMADYYGLYGYFASTQYPHAGTEHQKDRSDFVPLKVGEAEKTIYDSPVAWAVSDKSDGVGDAKIHIAGDVHKKGEVARRAYIASLNDSTPEIAGGESGRLELANWIASADNPLTARVIVNRVWQYHFGRGIVATSSNFGTQCPPPLHLELLDWLARDFIDHGWSFKHLHKRIMLSAVYQLASDNDEANAKIDEPNEYYWRFDRQRMDAEAIRDSILAVSGALEAGSPGRHPFPAEEKLKFSQGNPFSQIYDHNHRSAYLMTPRLNKHPFLALFDGPDSNKSTEKRGESTVALQALYMMNSPFVEEKAAALATRVTGHSELPAEQIQFAYELLFARPPIEAEKTEATNYLDGYTSDVVSTGLSESDARRQAWTSLARVLLTSSEFLYID